MTKTGYILTACLWVAAAPGMATGTNLDVQSDGTCPSAEAVTTELRLIRPESESAPLSARLRMEGNELTISLAPGWTSQRRIPVGPDCADRARLAALVIAAWSAELPGQAADSPSLAVAIPAPVPAAPSPIRRRWIPEVGVSGFYSTVGGKAPGGRIEAGMFRRDGWFGARVFTGYQAAKSAQVSIGRSRYSRLLLGASAVFRLEERWLFASADIGLMGTLTQADGDGYQQNQSTHGFNIGAWGEARMGVRMGRVRVWAAGSMVRWSAKESLRVDRITGAWFVVSPLPVWDALLGLGAGFQFD